MLHELQRDNLLNGGKMFLVEVKLKNGMEEYKKTGVKCLDIPSTREHTKQMDITS